MLLKYDDLFEKEEKVDKSDWRCLSIIYTLYISYFVWLTVNLFRITHEAGLSRSYEIGFSVWTGIVVIVQIVVFVFSLKGHYSKYFNVTSFVFLSTSMLQYNFGLYYSHKIEAQKHINQRGINGRRSCVNLQTDVQSYALYLTILPTVVMADTLYPFPVKERNWIKSLQDGIGLLDFLDLAELIFSDFGCHMDYGDSYVGMMIVSIVCASLLSTMSVGLGKVEKDEEPTNADRIVTGLNILFTDTSFLIFRIIVMVREKRVFFGLLFVLKEILSFIMRLILIITSFSKKTYSPVNQDQK